MFKCATIREGLIVTLCTHHDVKVIQHVDIAIAAAAFSLATILAFCHSTQGRKCGSYDCSGEERYSRHKCFGETPDARACIFRNLYYSISDGHFVYFTCPEREPPLLTFARSAWHETFQENGSGSEDFLLSDYLLKHADGIAFLPGQGDLTFRVHSEHAVPPKEPVELAGVNVLWSQCCGGSTYKSFGHFLLETWFPMFRVLQDLEVISHNFQVLLLRSQGEHALHLLEHYFPAFTDKAPLLWPDVVQQAADTGSGWLRLCEIVVGAGGYTADMARRYPLEPKGTGRIGSGSAKAWTDFRHFMLHGAGVHSHAAANVFKVLVHVKNPDDRRKIDNLADIRTCLSTTMLMNIFEEEGFDQAVKVVYHEVKFQSQPVKEQLTELSDTSLYITTQGSAAFRWVFLPSGAAVILFGSPEGAQENAYPSFFEAPAWFAMSQLKFYRYPIEQNSTDEFVQNTSLITDTQGFWDVDVRPTCSKLEPLIRQIIHEFVQDHAGAAWGHEK